jgi:hypothetical protein
MIKNKEKFKKNQEVMVILNSLETAIRNKDDFAISILITRLDKQFNLKIKLTGKKK